MLGTQQIRISGFQGYAILGAITPEAAAEVAFPHAQVRSTPGFTQTVYDNIVAAARSGQFVSFNPGGCSGQPSAGGNIRIIQQGSSLALQGVSMGLTAAGTATAATLAPFTLGISALIGLFPLFFSHHAAAVAKEQRIVCAAVPAANNYLQQIDAAVRSGAASPQQGISAMQSLLADFTSQVQPIIKSSSSACNAACVWVKQLTAIVAEKVSQYQDLVSAQPAMTSGSGPQPGVASGSTMTIPGAAPASTSSSWLPIAALALLGFVVVRAL